MACRGYLLALNDACIARLRPLVGGDDAVIAMVQGLGFPARAAENGWASVFVADQ